EVNEGDVVVGPYNEGKLLRIGVVTGSYYYVEDASTHRHRIPVTWTVTKFPKPTLSEHIQDGLRSISTLSRVRREPELFAKLASDPKVATQLIQQSQVAAATDSHGQRNTWLVGSMIGN